MKSSNHASPVGTGALLAVEVDHVRFCYQGKPVLDDVTFQVEAGEFLGIIGPNGAGKTTLLKTVLGILSADSGRVRVFGEDPRRARMNRQIGYVPQRLEFKRDFPVSVMDVVLMGIRAKQSSWRGNRTAEDVRRARELVGLVGLTGLEGRPITSISGGQQQRAFLAQALCTGPRLLVLDEPTTGLDLKAQSEFYSLVKSMQHQMGLTVVAASHDLVALAANADKLMALDRRVYFYGKPDEVLNSTELKRLYGSGVKVGSQDGLKEIWWRLGDPGATYLR